MVSETTDYIFSESPFLIKGFSTPYRLDWTAKDEEMFYIRENIPFKYSKNQEESLRNFL